MLCCHLIFPFLSSFFLQPSFKPLIIESFEKFHGTKIQLFDTPSRTQATFLDIKWKSLGKNGFFFVFKSILITVFWAEWQFDLVRRDHLYWSRWVRYAYNLGSFLIQLKIRTTYVRMGSKISMFFLLYLLWGINVLKILWIKVKKLFDLRHCPSNLLPFIFFGSKKVFNWIYWILLR